jgi:hypothetical protein
MVGSDFAGTFAERLLDMRPGRTAARLEADTAATVADR